MAIIEGIRVTVYRKEGTGDEAEYSFMKSISTDENGDYSLSGLAAGTYRLKFSDPNGAYLTEYWNSKGSLETGNDIALSGATTAGGKDVVLGIASFIEGNVTDA
jgi:hypothetical protein